MDHISLSNIAVAIGTIFLAIVTAYYSHKNIKSSKDQLQVLQNQIQLQFSQQEPELHVTHMCFKGNRIQLVLSNLGNGQAYDIIVDSSINIMYFKLTEESKALLKSNPPEQWKELNLLGHYSLDVSKRITCKRDTERIQSITSNRWPFLNRFGIFKPHEYELLTEGRACTSLINLELGEPILQGKTEKKVFECEPFFLLHCKVSLLSEIFGVDYYHKSYSFNELKELLTQNHIRYISVRFSLVSRDKVQNPILHRNITSFVIDFEDDNSLEEAHSRERKTHIYPLDCLELQKRIGVMDADTYYHGKWGKRD